MHRLIHCRYLFQTRILYENNKRYLNGLNCFRLNKYFNILKYCSTLGSEPRSKSERKSKTYHDSISRTKFSLNTSLCGTYFKPRFKFLTL